VAVGRVSASRARPGSWLVRTGRCQAPASAPAACSSRCRARRSTSSGRAGPGAPLRSTRLPTTTRLMTDGCTRGANSADSRATAAATAGSSWTTGSTGEWFDGMDISGTLSGTVRRGASPTRGEAARDLRLFGGHRPGGGPAGPADEAASAEPLQRHGDRVLRAVGRPGLGKAGGELGEAFGHDHLVGRADAEHRPPGAGLGVDLVDLEGHHR